MKWTNSYRSFGLKTKRSTGLKTIEHKQANSAADTADQSASGSSPRVRGKRRPVQPTVYSRRIIPARAGQTSMIGLTPKKTSDHPRACGANDEFANVGRIPNGSSPRVRGKRRRPRPAHQTIRIIPARAGQTRRRTARYRPNPDHPRACGANPPTQSATPSSPGSSPRVRGKPASPSPTSSTRRIIPARAGQTCVRTRDGVPSSDHPRACGANLVGNSFISGYTGSSPRVRGKLAAECLHVLRERIIPARAGQTWLVLLVMVVSPDHPRACGANIEAQQERELRAGSSPRVRGKPHQHQRDAGRNRIIPARAGQTDTREITLHVI